MATTSDDPAVARARAAADPLRHLLLVDDARKPIGWVAADHIHDIHPMTDEMASQSSPLFDRRTTLKDALSMLLDADVQAGLVVDRTGALRGRITVDDITALMREQDARPLNATERAAADAAADEPAGERDADAIGAGAVPAPGDAHPDADDAA